MFSPYANTMGGFPDGGLGAATIYSTHSILAIVTEAGTGMPELAYQCASVGADELLAPTIKFEYPSANSPSSDVYVQNSGTTTATITGTYTCRAAGSSVFTTHTIVKTAAAGTAAAFTRASIPTSVIPTGRLCSAVFTSPLANMAGTVTETTRGRPIPQVDDATYELIP